MTSKEIIANLCEKNGITLAKLERDLDFGNGSITKSDNLRSDRLLAIAKYFNVSMEYLMGEESPADQQRAFKLDNMFSGVGEMAKEIEYYLNDDTKAMAQFMFDHPEYKVLFDASRKVKPEDLKKAAQALGIFTDDEGSEC